MFSMYIQNINKRERYTGKKIDETNNEIKIKMKVK